MATPSLNQGNKRKAIAKKTSKYKGVHYLARVDRWCAKIEKDKTVYSLGLYDDEETAAQAYNRMAAYFFGEFALLNDVTENTIFDEVWIERILQHRNGFVGKSPYKGIRPNGRNGKGNRWRACAKDNGKSVTIGYYDTPEQASEAYQHWKEAKKNS